MTKQWSISLLALSIATGIVALVIFSTATQAQETPAQLQLSVADAGNDKNVADMPALQQSSAITQFTFWPISDTEHGLIRTDNLVTLTQILAPEGLKNFLRDKIESDYGFRNVSTTGTRYHAGIDIPASKNTQIVAVRDGYLERVYPDSAPYCLKTVVIRHASDLYTKYTHLSSFGPGITSLRKGSFIRAGQIIGYSGPPNSCTKYPDHLHFEVLTIPGPTNEMEYHVGPLVYYPNLNTYTPTISLPSVKGWKEVEFSTPIPGEITEICKSAWISVTVSTPDKDIDIVEIFLDSMILRIFDYNMGTSQDNMSMNFVTPDKIVGRTRFPQDNLSPALRSDDFTWSLVTCPKNVPHAGIENQDSFLIYLDEWDLSPSVHAHTLTIQITDAAGHPASTTLQIRQVQ